MNYICKATKQTEYQEKVEALNEQTAKAIFRERVHRGEAVLKDRDPQVEVEVFQEKTLSEWCKENNLPEPQTAMDCMNQLGWTYAIDEDTKKVSDICCECGGQPEIHNLPFILVVECPDCHKGFEDVTNYFLADHVSETRGIDFKECENRHYIIRRGKNESASA